jgi:UDP-glucose 4-epimerase
MAGRNVLVVGGAGYIGSHMVAALLEAGDHPITLDNLTRGHRDMVLGGEFIPGNCGDAALLDRIFAQYRIDAVMHFAAYSLVGESVQKPLDYWINNVGATAVLLERMVRHGVKRFIFSSTAAVYGEPAKVPIEETAPLAPANPYGASKAAVERMLQEAHAANGLQYVSLRYFNAAGAHPSGKIGEWHDPETHLIPLVLQVALGQRQSIAIFGSDYPTEDGTCVRDYVHVCDLAQAHLLALDALGNGKPFGIYNLGSSVGYSVREVIEMARQVTNKTIRTTDAPRRAGDPSTLIASSTAIRRELGWKPSYEALEAIVRTAWEWHRAKAG